MTARLPSVSGRNEYNNNIKINQLRAFEFDCS